MAILIPRPFQTIVVLSEGGIVFVRKICFQDTNYGHRVDEAGDIINMSVGIVPNNTFRQPNDLANSQGSFEELLNFTAAHVGIAILVQQALLRREAGSGAVNFDGSSFENNGMIE